jgi:hypothetical protein
MNKYILGSGLTGLVARHILGDSWKLIPFGRSRFYSTRPVLGNNYIVRSAEMDGVLEGLEFLPSTFQFTRAFSMVGQLVFSEQSFAKKAYISKIFGANPHPAAEALIKTELTTYKISATELYLSLLAKYLDEIRTSTSTHGKVVAMSDHHIKTEKSDLEFDKIISTIPLDVMLGYFGQKVELPAKNVWYYHIKSPSINLEGAREALVVDNVIDFHKVTNTGPQEYLFHSLNEIVTPIQYFTAFIGNRLQVLNQTSIANALPAGLPPDLKELEAAGVYPVGDHGQWDYFMDISSCVNRIRKISNLSGV